jgi:hypothetical protein
MRSPRKGNDKSAMSNQAPDHAPNFSKMALRVSVKAQVGKLSGKCAPLDMVMKNQQCPIRALTLPKTLPMWSFAFLLRLRLGS